MKGLVGTTHMNERQTKHISENNRNGSERDESGDEDEQRLNLENSGVLEIDHLNLLVKINKHGSVVRAAKALGISFKTAWDIIIALNNHAGKPLVYRMATGKGDGITLLTEEGTKIITQFILCKKH